MSLDRCSRCQWRFNPDTIDATGWNNVYVNSRIASIICPACQTPEENEEAIHNLARFPHRRRMTDARVVDTPTLVRLNQTAVLRGWISLADETIETLDPGGDHLWINAGGTPEATFVWMVLNANVERGTEVINPHSGEAVTQVVHLLGAEGEVAHYCWLEIEPHEWMGGEPVFLEIEAQEVATVAVKALFAEAGVDLP